MQANAKQTIPGYTLQFVPKDDDGSNGDTTLKVISLYKLGLNNINKPDWIFTSLVRVL